MLGWRFALLCRLGAQPQRYMLGLHGGTDYPHQLVAQRYEVGLLSQPGVEGGQGLCGILLPAVEAAVHQPLDALAQRAKHGCYQ